MDVVIALAISATGGFIAGVIASHALLSSLHSLASKAHAEAKSEAAKLAAKV